jgi:glycosyltransferase involved in cell wall biosynthesis
VGGSETRWLEVSRQLAQRHEVHVFTMKGDPSSSDGLRLPTYELLDGVHIHRVCTPGSRVCVVGTRSIPSCVKFGLASALELRHMEFDVYDFNNFPLVHLGLAKLASRRRAVITWHEVWSEAWPRHDGSGLTRAWVERLVARLDWRKHICVSEFTANRLNAVLQVPEERIEVVTNGVRPDFFGHHEKDFGKVIFVGRLSPHKHAHDLLLQSFIKASKMVPGLHLCIIGDGPLASLMAQKTRNMENVRLYANLPTADVVQHVKSSMVACFPSELEGDGIAAKETLAAGCPVVTTDFQLNAIAHNLVMDDVNGYVVSPEPKLLAEGIVKAIENWDRLHENCPEGVKEFTWDSLARRLESVYEGVSA